MKVRGCMHTDITIVMVHVHIFNRRLRGMKPLRAHGAWWIIIFLYSQVAYTSMSILNCPRVRGSDQSITAVSISLCHCSTTPFLPLLSPSLLFILVSHYIALVRQRRNWVFHWQSCPSSPTSNSHASCVCLCDSSGYHHIIWVDTRSKIFVLCDKL